MKTSLSHLFIILIAVIFTTACKNSVSEDLAGIGHVNELYKEYFGVEGGTYIWIQVADKDYPFGAITTLDGIASYVYEHFDKLKEAYKLDNHETMIKSLMLGQSKYIFYLKYDYERIQKNRPNDVEESWARKGRNEYLKHYTKNNILNYIPQKEFVEVIKRLVRWQYVVSIDCESGDLSVITF